MLNPKAVPLSDFEIEYLDRLLTKYRTDYSLSDVAALDGFLTAIVSGPVAVMPSEWMPAIWGGDEFAPEWELEEEVMAFTSLAMQIHNYAARTLTETPGDFELMASIGLIDGKPVEDYEPWCTGYMRALQLRPHEWNAIAQSLEESLGRIMMFGTDYGETMRHQLPQDVQDGLPDKLAEDVRRIHAHYLAERSAGLASPQRSLKQIAKVGRNDPCPCGSGKKFKKCCLQ